jgi:hypothetical protein
LIDFHPFYRTIVKSRKSEQLFKIGQNHLAKGIENKLLLSLDNKQPALVPIPILSNYLASEIFTLLTWWLEENMPYKPEEMDEIFHQLIIPGFQAALSGN